jgi:membrane-associated phospholipid phosphatase
MTAWPLASGLFFGYAAVLAAALPRLPWPRRRTTLAFAAAGLALSILSARLPFTPLLHDWLLAPALLLTAYWTSGRLFTAPMPGTERLLLRMDRALRIRATAARLPRVVAECLELAYVGVYPLVAVAFLVELGLTDAADPQRFWTVVLVTDYVCFAALPWIQTRPPRSLEQEDPWPSRVRRFNLRLLGATSIHVNTFPSGHTAEALAAALLVLDAPLPWVVLMFFSAAAVSAGAVFGRYHFALDAIAGWIVALVVWWAIQGC